MGDLLRFRPLGLYRCRVVCKESTHQWQQVDLFSRLETAVSSKSVQ